MSRRKNFKPGDIPIGSKFGSYITLNLGEKGCTRSTRQTWYIGSKCVRCSVIRNVSVSTLRTKKEDSNTCVSCKQNKVPNVRLEDQLFYGTWSSMLDRCHNPKSRQYRDYGARGITVDPAWRTRPEGLYAFAAYIGPKPNDGRKYSIDRIDNDKGYVPGNVRWATPEEQANNKRSNRYVIHEGKRITFREVCTRFGIDYSLAWKRWESGWDIDDVVRVPANDRGTTWRGITRQAIHALEVNDPAKAIMLLRALFIERVSKDALGEVTECPKEV